MWNEFITAFSPFFDNFFGAVNEVLSIFFDSSVNANGIPNGISLFGVPIIYFVIFGILFTGILNIIFKGKD